MFGCVCVCVCVERGKGGDNPPVGDASEKDRWCCTSLQTVLVSRKYQDLVGVRASLPPPIQGFSLKSFDVFAASLQGLITRTSC